MLCETSEKLTREEYKSVGLLDNHAYSILNVILEEKDKLTRRLLILRNPWGNCSYKSESIKNEEDSKMNRNKFSIRENQTAGEFLMNFNDFSKYFESFLICKYDENQNECRYSQILFPKPNMEFEVIQMEITKTTKINVGLFQRGHRKKEKDNKKLLQLCCSIYKLSSNDYLKFTDLITCNYTTKFTFISCPVILEKGNYLIISTSFGIYNKDSFLSYNLSIHSSEKISCQLKHLKPFYLTDAVTRLIKSDSDHTEMTLATNVKLYKLYKGNFGLFIMIENLNKNNLKFEFSTKFLKSTHSSRKSHITKDIIPTMHRFKLHLIYFHYNYI